MAEVDVEVDGEIVHVILYSLKVTPSMKNVVYCVYVVFDENGTYMPKQSKCDCPNGWLFCSHTLACFLLIYLVQMKSEWPFAQIVKFLPVPIKSLQNYPFAASYIFGKLGVSKSGGRKGVSKKNSSKKDRAATKSDEDNYIATLAKSLAKDVPGYSKKYQVNDNDAIEETRLVTEAMTEDGKGKPSLDLCAKMASKVKTDLESVGGESVNKTKVTMEDLTSYNLELVTGEESDECTLQKLMQHERLYMMMEGGALSKDKTIWYYLDHYAADRRRDIARLTEIVDKKNMPEGPKSVDYSAAFLDRYFADWDDSD